jgi:hypothetical protein
MTGMFAGAFSFDQNLGNWNVSNVKYMTGMFGPLSEGKEAAKLSTDNYDSLLKGWSGLSNLQRDVQFDAGYSNHSTDGDNSKKKIIENYNWNITDCSNQSRCFLDR